MDVRSGQLWHDNLHKLGIEWTEIRDEQWWHVNALKRVYNGIYVIHGQVEQSNVVKLGKSSEIFASIRQLEQSNVSKLGKEGIDVRRGQWEQYKWVNLGKEGMDSRSGQSGQFNQVKFGRLGIDVMVWQPSQSSPIVNSVYCPRQIWHMMMYVFSYSITKKYHLLD